MDLSLNESQEMLKAMAEEGGLSGSGGLALGGNKCRKLEFLIGFARQRPGIELLGQGLQRKSHPVAVLVIEDTEQAQPLIQWRYPPLGRPRARIAG